MNPGGRKFENAVVKQAALAAEDILEHEGLELVEAVFQREPNGWILRLLIDRDGGVTIDDCSHISRQLSDVLDAKDIVPYAYRLEVSSPGVNRPLKKPKDFERFLGETVRIKTRRPVEGQKNFKGKLLEYRSGLVCLEVDGKQVVLPHDTVERANLEYDFGGASGARYGSTGSKRGGPPANKG